jgi:hypothetical protein
MKLFRVWWEDEHGCSIIIAADDKEAARVYEAEDPGEQDTPAGIDEIADLSDLTPRCVLGIE